MQQTPSYNHIYLSPHYDDASLSCGGAIYQQIQARQSVLVITICAASPNPDDPLSPFAKTLHQAWGNPEDVVATRRAEDQVSMEILGVDYRRLNFTDCIYRGNLQRKEWYYNSDADIFGEIHPADSTLINRIAEAITELVSFHTNTIFYAPLSVGHHVDHQLTQLAAWQLQQQGWAVAFYEDYPYSDSTYPFTSSLLARENLYSLDETLAAKQSAHLQSQLRRLSEEDLQTKVDSIRAYASQLHMLFGGEVAMEEYVRRYALNVGQGKPAERIWISM